MLPQLKDGIYYYHQNYIVDRAFYVYLSGRCLYYIDIVNEEKLKIPVANIKPSVFLKSITEDLVLDIKRILGDNDLSNITILLTYDTETKQESYEIVNQKIFDIINTHQKSIFIKLD